MGEVHWLEGEDHVDRDSGYLLKGVKTKELSKLPPETNKL